MTSFSTRRLGGPTDLLDIAGDDGWAFEQDGRGIAGRGEAQRVSPNDVVEVLASLIPAEGSDPAGPGPVAVGARPFSPNRAWDLVIPAFQVFVDASGDAWETKIGSAVVPPASRASAPGAQPTVTPVEADDDWCAAVANATRRIRAGEAEKIVLAREVLVESETPFAVAGAATRLRSRFPNCYVFNVDGLIGASPELLVERHGDLVSAQPMAGTSRRSNDPIIDAKLQAELVASPTYRHEHQVTIDMVHDTLLEFASYIDYEPEPSVVTLANVAHLATRVQGRLSQPAPSVLELVEALHPTPAVSGRPRDAALAAIAELEARDRGRYAGTVGWVDAHGNGAWAVTLRCAQIDPIDPRRARLHAGCGLVADSDPQTELAESRAKLEAALSALVD